MGRLQPGRHRGAGAGQPRRRLREHRARGPRRLPGRGSSEADRANSGNRDRSRMPQAPGRVRRRGIYDVEHDAICNRRDDPHRRRRPRAADRLRQRRQPAALARDDATEGNLGAPVARRDAGAAGAAAADRKPAAGGDRRRCSACSVGLLGTAAAARASGQQTCRSTGACSASSSRVTPLTGVVFGIVPALRATRVERQRRAEGDQPQRRRLTRACSGKSLLVAQVAISLVLLVGAGLFLRTLQNLRQRRRRLQSAEPAAVPRQPALNRYDEPRSAALYDRHLANGSRGARRARCGLSQPALLSGSVNIDRHLRSGPHRRHDAAAGRRASTGWSSRRTSSRRWRFRSSRAAASPIATTATARRRSR